MVQNRKTRGRGRWTIKDHDIEVVRCFRYLGTGISSTNVATEEIRVRIAATALCKLCLCLHKCTKLENDCNQVFCYARVTFTSDRSYV
jgi:hypothetical protein